ncbi:hypothetical protein [Halomonas sp. DN3]|nr:hypothetical protein [Halomonas sp. DN3]USZ51766.1 hypothetical protein NKF27_09845 [Halomonas sp. DN3]
MQVRSGQPQSVTHCIAVHTSWFAFSKPGVEKLWRQMMKLPRDFLEA